MRFAGRGSDRAFVYTPIHSASVAEASQSIAGWFGLAHLPPWLRLVLILGALALLTPRLWRQQYRGPIVALSALAYVGMLLVTRLFFDTGVSLTTRMAIPLFGMLLFALSAAVPRAGLIAILASLTAVHAGTLSLDPDSAIGGGNSNHPSWRRSEVLARLSALPDIRCRYGTSPDAVYLHTGKPVNWVPRRLQGYSNRQATTWCDLLKATVRERGPAAFAFFDVDRNRNMQVTEGELSECLEDVTRLRLSDGVLILTHPNLPEIE
jgi:hypothetical protein